MLAQLALVAALAAPAMPAHATHVDVDCRRLNNAETTLCAAAVKIAPYVTYVTRADGTVARVPKPSGRVQVRVCRSNYPHPGKQLTACLAAIHGPRR